MIPQNKAAFDALGVTKWHEAGYTGKGQKIITFERFEVPDAYKDRIIPLWPDEYPLASIDTPAGWHGLQMALMALQYAPDATIYQILPGFTKQSDGTITGPLVDKTIPWIMEFRPCAGFRSKNSNITGLDKVFAPTFPFLSLFQSAGNDGTNSYAREIEDECWFGVGAVRYDGTDFIPEDYSSVDDDVDYCGLAGQYILSLANTPMQVFGTSPAAPAIAAMMALVNSVRPMSHDEAKAFIYANCRDIHTPGKDSKTGQGVFILPDPATFGGNMKIIEEQYAWAYPLTPRTTTTHLIIHHEAASGSTAQQIHTYHLSKGWAGIAYNYYIRKDGSIYRGRPENMIGGHTLNYNHWSIGVCFEGNFDTETMPRAQIEAGKWAVADILSRYPDLTVCRHSDLNATACPGKNFPFAEITQEEPEMRYNTIAEIPEWGKPTIQKLIDKGALKGTGEGFNISEDMLRMFVINDRMGLYD